MKQLFWFLSLGLIVVLSACQAPPAPATAAQPSSTTAPTTAPITAPASPATPTTAAVEPPTATATATTAGPCTDLASFVADVTVPDYAHFDPRAAFTKTWRVKNAGTCTWTSDYKAVYSRGDALGAPTSIPLSQTAPGSTLDISANMAAPGADGKYQIIYQLTNAAGNPMPIDAGDSLWAIITVGKYLVAAPTAGTPGTGSSGSTAGTGLPAAACVTASNAAFLSQLVTLINAARASSSLPALTSSDKLNAAAQSHSQDMACNNFLAHTGWNGSSSSSRIAAAGYSASTTLENIYGQPPQYGGDAKAAVDWWMSDPIHRDAILNPQVKEIGVGYASYSRSDLVGYFTVDFAAP